MLNYSLLDKALIHVDTVLRSRKDCTNYPAHNTPDSKPLSTAEKQQSISMMRINHSGEVCAQALYQGQALMAKNAIQYNSLIQAATEENAHLNWCKQRLQELNGRTSILNPIWYAGSFAIGVLAGAVGDQISLGFLAETEYQVTAHLEKHLRLMAPNDLRSRCILEQMRSDELQHATKAVAAGGVDLPGTIKILMRYIAKVLTITTNKI